MSKDQVSCYVTCQNSGSCLKCCQRRQQISRWEDNRYQGWYFYDILTLWKASFLTAEQVNETGTALPPLGSRMISERGNYGWDHARRISQIEGPRMRLQMCLNRGRMRPSKRYRTCIPCAVHDVWKWYCLKKHYIPAWWWDGGILNLGITLVWKWYEEIIVRNNTGKRLFEKKKANTY